MKAWIKSASLVAVLALGACGGGGGDDSKDLFSIWTRDGDNATFDLRGGQFSTPLYMYFFAQNGTRCICTTTVIGTEEQGSYAISSCIASPYSASADKLCKPINGTGNYTNSNKVLTLTGHAAATFH